MIWVLVIGFIIAFITIRNYITNFGAIDILEKGFNYWFTVTGFIIGVGSFLGSGLVLVIRVLK